ncbi:hypothetical protein HanIR_Chr17g0871571 [Helianthus annuus]|nr:hypothetical protein HanIR_Chr17g0871571 [Helianthus annuus]
MNPVTGFWFQAPINGEIFLIDDINHLKHPLVLSHTRLLTNTATYSTTRLFPVASRRW